MPKIEHHRGWPIEKIAHSDLTDMPDLLGTNPDHDTRYSLTFQMSLLRVANTIALLNDLVAPGNNQYYGTNAIGAKGWFPLPPPVPEADPLFTAWLAVPPNVSTFVNDVPYLIVEADPVFMAWVAVPPNISIFNNDVPYLIIEADPIFSAWLAVPPNVSTFINDVPYLTTWGPEADPIFSAWLAVPPNVSIFTNDAGYISDLTGFDTDDLVEGLINLYYTDARVQAYSDVTYLKLDGSNANTTIDIGSQHLTTTGDITAENVTTGGIECNGGIYQTTGTWNDGTYSLTPEQGQLAWEHSQATTNPHSTTLDQSYDAGSTIAIDTTDVVWNIGSGKSFLLKKAVDASNLLEFSVDEYGAKTAKFYTNTEFRGGGGFDIWDAGNTKEGGFWHDGTDFEIYSGVGTGGDIKITPAGPNINCGTKNLTDGTNSLTIANAKTAYDHSQETTGTPHGTAYLANTNDIVNDTHIDWGIGANQVNSADMPIGAPTDTNWTDGLLPWTDATLAADALDDVNEILSYLAPADALALSGNLTMAGTTKYSGYLSQGNTNYKTGDPAGTLVTYIITDPTFTLTSPNTTTTYNKADEGYTKWYKAVGTAAYGSASDSVDHAANFQEANRAGTQTTTPWTTGQIAVTSVAWYNSFPKWQKGNAVITITAAQLLQGYNRAKMTREGSFAIQSTNDYEVFYDNDAGANPSVDTPTVAEGATVNTRKLSGVNYYNRGTTFKISVVGSRCFNNVYTQYPLVIISTASNCMGNASVAPSDATVSGVSTPPAIGETMTVTDKVITVPASNVRSTNARVTVTPGDPYGTYTGVQSASANRLVDGYLNTAAGTSTDLAEYFDDEWYRLLSNFDIESTTYSSGGAGGWDSTVSLVSGTAGYDGLQTINGTTIYPVTNYTSGYLPSADQVNYSAAAGNRVYTRYFYVGTGIQNFTWTISGTTASFVSVATGPSGNNLTFEMLAPATTKDAGNNTVWKDCYVAYTTDTAVGCYTSGTRSAATTNWVTTLGTKSTATSGFVICVRITAAAAWAGNLSTLSVVGA